MLPDRKAVLVLLLSWMGGSIAGCAAEELYQHKLTLFFDQRGAEYDDPSLELYGRLVDAPDPGPLIATCLDVLESNGAYSRVVAARALCSFFSRGEHQEYLTDRLCRVFANELIQIADDLPPTYLKASDVREGKIGERIIRRIRTRTVIECEGHPFVLRRQLPWGWTAEDGTIELDGKVVVDAKGSYGDYGVEILWLWKHLKPEGLVGTHRVRSRVVLVAPNGLRIPKEQTVILYIVEQVF